MRTSLQLRIPTIDELRGFRRKLDKEFDIENVFCPREKSSIIGAYVHPKKKILMAATSILKEKKLNCLKIKLSCDGTLVGRRHNLLNFVFSFADDSNNSTQKQDCIFLLGIFKIKSESFDILKECLSDLLNELKQIDHLEIDLLKIPIDYVFAADYKMLLTCLGLKAANSNNPCIYCHMDKDDLGEPDKWPANFPIEREVNGYHKFKEDKGYKQASLIDFIEIRDFIPCELHLLLRIGGKLIELLIKELKGMDGYTNAQELDQLLHMKTYYDYLETDCRIGKHFLNSVFLCFDCKLFILYFFSNLTYKGRSLYKKSKDGEDDFKIRQLVGAEMKTLFSKIDLEKLFPNLNSIKEKHFIWKEFFQIYELIKSENVLEMKPDKARIPDTTNKTYSEDSILFEIQNRTSHWLRKFISVYQKANVTPYMHILQAHIHQIIEKHGSLRTYSQQGAEKFNDIVTMNYFRSTNRNRNDFLNQLVKKANRVELLRTEDDSFVDDDE